MARLTKTEETDKAEFEVTLTREVQDHIADFDGIRLTTGREVYENWGVKITVKANGKMIQFDGRPGEYHFLKQVTNKFGQVYTAGDNGYIGKPAYDTIRTIMDDMEAELPKTDEQVAIETAEARRQAAFVPAPDEPAHGENGYCRICHSYCYGDCQANR